MRKDDTDTGRGYLTISDKIRTNSSEARLENLIAQRAQPGADKVGIDARIWDLFGERWAVMFTDLSGFSRMTADFGITHFLQVTHESHRLTFPIIEAFDGILLKIEADSLLVIFRSPARSMQCALEIQSSAGKYNQERSENESLHLCIGLGYGDMLRVGDQDVFGYEVNAASRLGEDTADRGEILVTPAFRDAVGENSGVSRFELLKNPPRFVAGALRVLYQSGQPD